LLLSAQSSVSLAIEQLNSGDEKVLLSYAKIGKATVNQIIRARECHRFESVGSVGRAGLPPA
jgi:DNA uptake protein ComE-like DNA-binding protein